MNYRSIFATSAALLLSSAAANAAQVAALIGGDTIAMVDTAQKKATGSVKVTGISGALVGVDVRPADGMLYGLVDDGTIVTIAMDGKATMKSKLDTMLAKGVAATVDFNPVADRLRVMGADGMNLRADSADAAAGGARDMPPSLVGTLGLRRCQPHPQHVAISKRNQST